MFNIQTANVQDIQVKEINTELICSSIGQRKIKQFELLYNNMQSHLYDLELLILISCEDASEPKAQPTFELFGAPTEVWENGMIEAYEKKLKFPISDRKTPFIGFLRINKGINLVVFEDSEIVMIKSEANHGVLTSWQLEISFEKVNGTIFDTENNNICIQSFDRSRSIFHFEPSPGNGRWVHLADHMNTKWTFLSLYGKFVIARNLDKFTYLLELNETFEIASQVKIGDEDSWNYFQDSYGRWSQFIILYEKAGKNFQWQKYDLQNQFHLSKLNYLEQVCNGTLIKIFKDQAKIEVKKELSRFEDKFYEFQTMRFIGLPIFVSSFTIVMIPSLGKKFLLCIKPEATLLNRKVLPQYFVYLDCDQAIAYECILEESLVFTHIYFVNEASFIGQRSISPTVNVIESYLILKSIEQEKDEKGETNWYLRKSTKSLHKQRDQNSNVTRIVKNDPFVRFEMKGITCVDYDYDKQLLYLIRSQILEAEDECVIYRFDLKKYLQWRMTKKDVAMDQKIEKVARIVAKLQLFTSPVSVLRFEDKIIISACFNKTIETVYALATTSTLSLLYRADLRENQEIAKGLMFEQIITITNALKLIQINTRQLSAISKTQIVVFQLDSEECNDIKHYFEPENTEVQCKRLIGKNIDLKLDFDSNIVGITSDSNVVAVIFGSQSLLLEFDESQYPRFSDEEIKEQMVAYKKSIKNLNDLVYVFKQILAIQYNNAGYIRITEDQGQWDQRETFCPVTVYVSDFVTIFQDEDGNQGSDESSVVRHLYQNNYNIWESIFRDAIATERLEISYEQINRFLSPVITDHGNNLLFHFCYNKPDILEEIINLPGFEEYYKADKKMFPIFYNFFGVSQITIALAAHDKKSFYKLMFVLINMQDCFESSFLINSWMLQAFEQGLDIFPLLESQILQTVCSVKILEHFGRWPQFHRNTDTFTVNYNKSFMSLTHDEEAYYQLFGQKYAEIEKEDEQLLSQNLYDMSPDENRNLLFPIKYFAERLPSPAKTPNEQLDYVFELFEILSETEQMSYFRSGFIQRLIMYHWNGPLVRYYSVVSGFYLASFSLVILNVLLLGWQNNEPYKMTFARTCISGFNVLVLCLSLCSFEIKSFLADKAGYIQSFWNQNDMCLFFTSATVFVLELRALLVYGQGLDDLYPEVIKPPEEEEEEEDLLRMILRRILKKKKSRGNLTFDVKVYYGYPEFETWLRMVYAILTINSFLKVLNVSQFSENVAFLIKMLEYILKKFKPFIFFWFGIMIMFSLCIQAIDLVFYNSDSITQGGDYDGFLGMYGACLMYTVRNSVGDFQPDTIKFLPRPQRITMWIYWFMITIISVIIFMNFTIALINDSYQESIPTRIEEGYQKKCGILCELNGVFGGFATKSQTSILVTRECPNSAGAEEENESLRVLKKQLLADQIELNELLHETKKDLMAQNEITLQQIKTIRGLLVHADGRADAKKTEQNAQLVQQQLQQDIEDAQ